MVRGWLPSVAVHVPGLGVERGGGSASARLRACGSHRAAADSW